MRELWAHEARRVSWPVLAVPVVTVLTGAVLIAAVAGGGLAGRLVPGAVETLLPLAAGIVVAATIGRDPARELQLSLPTGYGGTLARRLAVGMALLVVGALLLTGAALVSGHWPAVPGVLTAQLVWLAPAAFLGALGAAVTLASASGVLGTATVGALWVIEASKSSLFLGRPWQPLYLFADGVVPAAPFHGTTGHTLAWWQDRVALCLAAVLFTMLAVAMARRPERLLRSAQ